jgi:anti-sigma28 factor (negative regulator of flagellin synthesis)
MMAIEPVNGPHFLEKAYSKDNPGRKHRKAVKDTTDTAKIQISEEARKLKKLEEEARVEGLSAKNTDGIDSKRVKEIRERIRDGYYEKPEVQNDIAAILLHLFLPEDE